METVRCLRVVFQVFVGVAEIAPCPAAVRRKFDGFLITFKSFGVVFRVVTDETQTVPRVDTFRVPFASFLENCFGFVVFFQTAVSVSEINFRRGGFRSS